ncbi:MAG: hypothetical protein IIC81_02135, partial [Chloroflexi bacterium]|nr:hypothetical protein [Chloroflexota bacterium]
MRVELPDGSSDWVGDSARRAVRAGKCCSPNEILVSEPVRDIVLRDFAHESANVEQRPLDQQLKEGEEAFTLYVLGKLKLEAATELGAFECYVYTLDVIGEKEEAAAAAPQWAEAMRREGIQPDVVTYNTLISKAPSYETAEAWVETMRREGIQPNVVTYNTLISKAPDYPTAMGLLETMRDEGIQPNVVTYNTLISKATSYDTAKAWVE